MRTPTRTLIVAALASVIAFLGFSRVANGTATIRVLLNETHQTIEGWEVTPKFWETNKTEDRYDASWIPYRDQILDRLVNELGINRVRLEVRSGMENPIDYWRQFETGQIGYREFREHRYEKINDNEDPNTASPTGFQFSQLNWQVEQILIPLRRLVEANGERIYINLCFVDFEGDLEGNLQHALKPDEYAEFINEAFLHLKTKYGIAPDSLEIILEPDNTEHWRGTQIGAAMVKAVQRLRANGFSPEIVAPSTAAASKAPAYFDEMIQVPGVLDVLSTISYHRYDHFLEPPVAKIRDRADQHRLKTAMLEHLTGNAQELHTDLKDANVSAWQMWGIAHKTSKPEGVNANVYYEVNVSDPAHPRVWMTLPTRMLAQYFKFIRRGAIRIGATSNTSSKDPVAFRNPDGTYVLVVKASCGGDMFVLGLPPGSYRICYTSESQTVGSSSRVDLAEPVLVKAGQGLTASMPGKGVITIYQTRSEGSRPKR